VLEAAMAARKAGDFSEVLRGQDGVYVVRVVDIEPQRERPFEQLATGIHQRLLQERMAAAEQSFRKEVLKRVRVQVREDELERIDPLAPPAAPQPPQPPAMPNQ
jgi:parvulin-like peptidyl-prolyl isomerase